VIYLHKKEVTMSSRNDDRAIALNAPVSVVCTAGQYFTVLGGPPTSSPFEFSGSRFCSSEGSCSDNPQVKKLGLVKNVCDENLSEERRNAYKAEYLQLCNGKVKDFPLPQLCGSLLKNLVHWTEKSTGELQHALVIGPFYYRPNWNEIELEQYQSHISRVGMELSRFRIPLDQITIQNHRPTENPNITVHTIIGDSTDDIRTEYH